MFMVGAVYAQPLALPGSRSPAPSSLVSGSSASQSGGVAGCAATSRPETKCTPESGSPARPDGTSSVVRAQATHRSAGPQRTGPQMAPAAAEVAAGGGAAVTTRVDSPASASDTAVVSPTTPAPTTTASTSVTATDITGAPPSRPQGGLPFHHGTAARLAV